MINTENKQSLDKVIDLCVCITDLAKVWQNDVKKTTIKNCFIKAGFAEKTTEKAANDLPDINACWNELQSTRAINDNINLTDYLAIDEDLIATEYPTNNDIIDSIKDRKHQEDDAEEPERPKPSKFEMLTAVETIRHGPLPQVS